MVAIIGGGVAALISKILGIEYLELGGLVVSVSLLFMVSFIDNRIKASRLTVGKTSSRILTVGG